ncbi:MAG TPA: DUF2059 domain-containing protein [Moraxellaceae bacterium]
MMRYLFSVLLLLLPLAATAADGSSAQLKLAEQYFDVSGIDQLYGDKEQLGKLMDSQLDAVAQAAQQDMSAEDYARFQTMLAKVRPGLSVAVAKMLQQMRPELVAVIAGSYSERELKALVAFYKSPEGRSVVAKNPQVMSAMVEVAGKYSGLMMQELQENLVKALQDSGTPSKKGSAGK